MKTLVNELAELLISRGARLGTAESCTGGMIGHELTAVAGSSRWYEGGVICYSNELKRHFLQVPKDVLEQYGAVSEQVALAMADGACRVLKTEVSVAVTGIAGPDGGSAEKPVGTVWLAWRVADKTVASCFQFFGDREKVREQAVQKALEGLLQLMS